MLTYGTALAGTPDWLRQAQQTQLPTYAEDTDAVVLLNERIATVSANGEVRTTYRKAFKILRPGAHDKGTVYVYFDNDTQLTFLKAWSITAQGEEYEVKEGDAIETAAFSESLYSDTRYKVLQIPAANPGSVVGYEYQQRGRPFVMQEIWPFQEDLPVRRARFTLELPSNWGYTAYWRNSTQTTVQQAGDNRWRWELADIEPIKSEPNMSPWKSVAGEMEVSFGPKSAKASDKSFSSWQEIGGWYAQLTADRREITPPIRDKARELLAGTTDPVEKIKRLTSYVQHGIRYVAIEIGIGGYRPHSAQEILASGYGDCKDKATLLSALLREAGFESYYVLINADRDFLSPDFPSPLGFDHVILAIALPGELIPDQTYAILKHERLGRLLLFDPTDDSTPLGYLPTSLQSNYGLLVNGTGGELLKLPLLSAGNNRILRVATLKLDEAGNLKGSIEEVRRGAAATELRERLLNLPSKQRQKIVQGILADLVDRAVLTAARLSPMQELTGSLALSYDFEVPAYAQHTGELILFRSCLLGRKGDHFLEGKPRRHPVMFRQTSSESDVIEISLPEGYTVDEIPASVQYDHPFATYKSETKMTEHTLHVTRTYELNEVRISTEQLSDLKKFFREIADDERSYAIFRAGAPTIGVSEPPKNPSK